MHSVRSRGWQHTSLSARRDAGFIDPNRLARRRTKPGDAGPSCEGVPTGGIASLGAVVADSVRIRPRMLAEYPRWKIWQHASWWWLHDRK